MLRNEVKTVHGEMPRLLCVTVAQADWDADKLKSSPQRLGSLLEDSPKALVLLDDVHEEPQIDSYEEDIVV